MLRAKVEANAWCREEFRAWQWDPSRYNVAGALGLALNTQYAPLPKRLRDPQQRLRLVPAYYHAAQNSLSGVTREHTELALLQAAACCPCSRKSARRRLARSRSNWPLQVPRCRVNRLF